MNYRHAYHAGHICDVVKHATLALLIAYMQRKEKGFALLDTHAGCGLYDLHDEKAQKTKESEAGIVPLWKTFGGEDGLEPPELLAAYLRCLKNLNPDGELRFYAGSPFLARQMLRPQDRLIACEAHPDDFAALRRTVLPEADRKNVQLHHRDGYAALKAFLPFAEKRGLILIDPPYEKPDEVDALLKALTLIPERAPQVTVAIWYPVKDRPTLWSFHERLREAKLGEILIAEFLFQPELRADRLNGTGFAFVNPPFILQEQLTALFPLLHQTLETGMGDEGSILTML